MADAWGRVEQWLELDNVWTPEPTHRHREILGALLTGSSAGPKLVCDAHLAVLALEHGGFARFRDLRWENPIA